MSSKSLLPALGLLLAMSVPASAADGAAGLEDKLAGDILPDAVDRLVQDGGVVDQGAAGGFQDQIAVRVDQTDAPALEDQVFDDAF